MDPMNYEELESVNYERDLFLSVIYRCLALDNLEQSTDQILTILDEEKDLYTEMVYCFPVDHPARLYYNKIKDIDYLKFSQTQTSLINKIKNYTKRYGKLWFNHRFNSEEDVEVFVDHILDNILLIDYMLPEKKYKSLDTWRLEEMAAYYDYSAIYELIKRYLDVRFSKIADKKKKYIKLKILPEYASDNIYYELIKKEIEICSNVNNYLSNYYLGKLYYEELHEYETAKYWFEKSLNDGYADSALYLGKLYYYGLSVDQKFDKAKEYFEICEKNNNLVGISYLGKMYYLGNGVEIDYKKAENYFEKSISDTTDSRLFLSMLYEYGLGVSRNRAIASKFFSEDFDFENEDINLIYDTMKHLSNYPKFQEILITLETALIFIYINLCINSDDIDVKDLKTVKDIMCQGRNKFNDLIQIANKKSIIYYYISFIKNLSDDNFDEILNLASENLVRALKKLDNFNIKEKLPSEYEQVKFVCNLEIL